MNILEYENYHENVTHGDIVFPYNTYLCSIPLDFPRVPLHWHDEVELIYIKKGRGAVTVDFRQYKVQGPTLLLILPGQLHSIEQYKNDAMEYENIIFHPRLLQSHDNDIFDQQYLTPLLDGMIQMPTFLEEVDTGFSLLYAPLKECEETDSPLMVESLLFLLCSRLLELYPERTERAARRDALERVKPVLVYVQDHYQEVITVADAAAQVDFSEAHFMRFFKQTLGMSFVTYLKNYRLAKAEEMLRTRDASVLDIAQDNGFPNVSYCIRECKARYGMTPLKYRSR